MTERIEHPEATAGVAPADRVEIPERPGERPIFIVGSPRSGTTLLRMIVDAHPRISCGPETHFLTALERVAKSHAHRVERYGFDPAYWDQRMREFFASFQHDYMVRRGKQRWAEKTPAYTLHLDFIDRLFPDAQYVHLIRDGRDVVASFRERWGLMAGIRAAAGEWERHVRAARSFGAAVGEARYFELRYEALVTDPEPELRRLFSFLGEAWDPAVLRFDEAEHDAARYAAFTAERRRESGETSAIYTSRVGAGSRSLNPILRLVLRLRADDLRRELGYRDQ